MTNPNRDNDDLAPAVGVYTGCSIAALVWVLIIWGFRVMAGCGK